MKINFHFTPCVNGWESLGEATSHAVSSPPVTMTVGKPLRKAVRAHPDAARLVATLAPILPVNALAGMV